MMLSKHTLCRSLAVAVCVALVALGALATGGTAFGATGPKPGEAAYYEARWAECVAKFSWADTGLPEWTGSAAQPAEGEGTIDDPYRVTTAEQFRWCLQNQKSCQLQNDLDLGGKSGKIWMGPDVNVAFVVDGNGHTVYNLYSLATARTGLIASTAHKDFVLKNIIVSHAQINSVTAYGAPLIGQYAAGQVLGCGVEEALVWQDNAKGGRWAVMAGAIGFGGYSAGQGGLNLTAGEKVVRDTYADGVHVYGGACSAGFIEAPYINTTIENCYAINGTLIVPAGHSGGFSSCDTGPSVFRNCFTNIDVYGNNQTGVFQGVTHGGSHVFENCYAAGKIEGTDTIGGFIGKWDAASGGSATTTFTNCYSTSMVGMASGGKNMGGFAGLGNGCVFTNCYAAGEVGTLRSAEDGTPLDAAGNKLTGQNVTGFAGDNGGTLVNCYYDKQTTGMCDNGIVPGKVEGLLTRQLIAAEGLQDIKDGEGRSVWIPSSGGYPELRTFVESDDATTRASSAASTATVHLYAAEDGSAYDTVRRIRYVFPLTNNANSGRDSFSVAWANYVGEDPENPLYPNISPILDGDIPIVTLSDVGTADNVSSVAPGIGWLQVNATEKSSGVVGMRRLRLVPTTAIAMASFGASGLDSGDVVTSLPSVNLDGMRVPDNQSILYDHRDTINFVTTTSTALNSFLLDETNASKEDKLEKYKITSIDFPKDTATSSIGADGRLSYDLGDSMDGDKLNVVLYKQNDKGEFEAIPWTDDLEALLSGGRTAKPEDCGVYQLGYEWVNADGSVLKAQGSKVVTIGEPAYVVYHWNDGVHVDEAEDSALYEVYKVDPGCYLVGTSVGANLPSVPEREGYDERYWATAPEGDFGVVSKMAARLTSTDGNIMPLAAPGNQFTGETSLHAGRNDVYAVWVANKHSFTVCDDEGNVISTKPDVSYDEPVLDVLDELGAKDKIDDPDGIIGWTFTPGGSVADVTSESTMPDTDVSLYPVRSASPAISKAVRNLTHPTGENNVGDRLAYTIEATNKGPANSGWRDALITDALPAGLTYVPGTLKLAGPDGATSPIADAEAFDAATGTLSCTVPLIKGGETYRLTFEATINAKAIDPADTEEGAANRDIGNVAVGSGRNSDGAPITQRESDPATPNPRPNGAPDGTPGAWPVTPFDPAPAISKEVVNATDPDASVQVGDTLQVTVTITNAEPNSVWGDVTVTDKVPDGVTVVPGSIKVVHPDGTTTSLPDDAYNPETGEIVFRPGSIGGGEVYQLVYEELVGDEAHGADIGSAASAEGSTPHGEDADVTSGDPSYPEVAGGDKNVYWGDPERSVVKIATNLSRGAGDQTRVGDRIRYEVTVGNSKDGSLWTDVVAYDQLPEGVKPDTGTLKILGPGGVEVAVSKDAYDASTRVIAVYVGDLFAGQQAVLSFEATVDADAAGADIGNVGAAHGGTEVPGGEWIEGGPYSMGDPYHPGRISIPDDAVRTQPVYPHEADARDGVLSAEGTKVTRLAATGDFLPIAALLAVALVAALTGAVSCRRRLG